MRARELLAASVVELLKTALAGSAPAAGEPSDAAGPEAVLDSLHAQLQAAQQDAAHTVAAEHTEAWGSDAQWEAYHAAFEGVSHLLMKLHTAAAAAGSADGAVHVRLPLLHVPHVQACVAVQGLRRACTLANFFFWVFLGF